MKGTGDNFYKQKQLLPENFEAAAKEAGHDIGPTGVNVRYQAVRTEMIMKRWFIL